ncbi:MAG: DUF2878 domain-containing protein [Pseudomonadota bacterium]
MRLTVNFLAFLAGWFGSVLGAAAGMPWVGPVIVTMVAALHLSIVPQPRRELVLLLSAAALGLVIDSLMAALGWVRFETGVVVEGLAPYWIIVMWVGFATTLNTWMRWLRAYPLLAVGFGLLGGPLVYWFGSFLGALELNESPMAVIGIALCWGLVMPVLYALARRFDGTLTSAGDMPTHLAARRT